MNIPLANDIHMPSEEGYSQLLQLQNGLNEYLQSLFNRIKGQGREVIASTLINEVESLVDEINNSGYNFGRSDYGGSINYEESEQWYSNGEKMGDGINLCFIGFSVQVSWAKY